MANKKKSKKTNDNNMNESKKPNNSNKKKNNISSNNKSNKKSDKVKEYKKKKLKKDKRKISIGMKFNLDILDILIIVVLTAIVSCVFTGFILNHQYKKNHSIVNGEVVDKKVSEFLNTYDEIINNYYEEIDKDAMMDAAISGMLNFLEDNYSIYLNKNETDTLSSTLDSSYEGLGILSMGNVVQNVYKKSPAERVGIKVGDEIVSVNGNKITMDNFQNIGKYISNKKENEIIVKRDGKEITYNIKTDKIEVPSTSTDIITSSDKKKRIGYITLNAFSSRSYDEFKDDLKEMEKKDINSLIIDLRNNNGGYLSVAEDISSLFIEKDKIIYTLESKGKKTDYKDETKEKREYKIIVLVNRDTASAAEILTAALHDSYGATVVGKTTFGKGKVQTIKYLNGTMVKYTTAKWYRPNGECIDEVGIKPDYDIDLEYSKDEVLDKQLDKAIELLSK